MNNFPVRAGRTSAARIGEILSRLRETHPDMARIFTEGGCFQLFLILDAIHPGAECWYDGNHVYTKLFGYWWDINGRYDEKPEYAEIIDPEVMKRAYHWKDCAWWSDFSPRLR